MNVIRLLQTKTADTAYTRIFYRLGSYPDFQAGPGDEVKNTLRSSFKQAEVEIASDSYVS